MFSRLFTLLPVAALVAVAAATPNDLEARTGSQCNTGPMQCCQNTYTSTDVTLLQLASTLGLALPSIDGLFGLGCSPITVIGTGAGAMCAQQPVCCTGNTFNGLLNVGCTPINLGL